MKKCVFQCILYISILGLTGCSEYPKEEVFYYSSGKLKARIIHYNSSEKRDAYNYYENGKLYFVRNWEDENNGVGLNYDSLGNLSEKAIFRNKLPNGPIEHYYPSGKIKIKGQLRNGKEDGIANEYFEDGKFRRKYVHDNGELIYYKSYDKNGKLVGSELKIDVTPVKPKEFYSINDSIEFEIKLIYSDHKKMIVQYGKLDENGFMIGDEFYAIISDSLTLIDKVKPNKLGENEISGILVELKNVSYSGDTIITDKDGSYYFRYKYIVK